MEGIIAYVLSKRYTKETAAEFGAVKGAPCTIKSITHQNKQNIVTFEWKNSAGETKESTMVVEDGTPIYEYIVGDTYKYGDIVIYASALYRCTVTEYVAEPELDTTKFAELGSPDGNYDIVQNSSLLPPRFTSADRKLYYSIEDSTFFLWNGEAWVKQGTLQQYDSLPTPATIYLDRIVQYVGETTVEYTQGYFYKCEYEDGTYKWLPVDTQEVKELTTEQMTNLISLL